MWGVFRIVEEKMVVEGGMGMIRGMGKEIVWKEFLMGCSWFEKGCGDNVVSMEILEWERDRSSCYDIEFVFDESDFLD